MPLRTPQRANVAALSLRSCLREVLHLQILRRCFQEKHRHGRRTRQAKEKVFAICGAPYFNIIYQQTGGASPSPTKIATPFAIPACRAWWQDGGRCRKSIDVFLPSLLCSAARRRFPKAAAFGPLSWFVLSRMRKNEHPKQTSNACHRHSVRVRRRSCKKFNFPATKLPLPS